MSVIEKFKEEALKNYKLKFKKAKAKSLEDVYFNSDNISDICGKMIKNIQSPNSIGEIFKFYYQDGLFITHAYIQVRFDFDSWDEETYIDSIKEVFKKEVTIYE